MSRRSHQLSMTLGPTASLELQLFDDIDRTNSSYKVLATKVDVLLQKSNAGSRWPQLEAAEGAAVPSYESGVTQQQPPASASASAAAPSARSRSKWDQLKLDDDDDEAQAGGEKKSGAGEGAGVDAFFQKLYADADDDTRRAMMKSYTESGGTTLSTNWAEVGKGEVSVKPPEGMEARKWNER